MLATMGTGAAIPKTGGRAPAQGCVPLRMAHCVFMNTLSHCQIHEKTDRCTMMRSRSQCYSATYIVFKSTIDRIGSNSNCAGKSKAPWQ